MKKSSRYFSSRDSGVFRQAKLPLKLVSGLILSGVFQAGLFAAPVDATPAPRNLVTESVVASQHHVLAEHRAAWATTQNDRGEVPADLPLQHLTLELQRTAEREQAFQQLLRDQQDPASADYHRWLTPVEIGEQFGASQQDIDAISAWLNAQGLQVGSVANSRTRITFSGNAGAVASALTTSMHYYQTGSETRIANASDPQIPAALANVVRSVHGLYANKHRTQNRMSVHSRSALQVGSTRPEDTYCPPNGSCQYTVFPADFSKIYDMDSLSAQGITGSGQTIAIVGKARVYSADLTNFEKFTGVTFPTPTVIVPADGTDPGSPATTCSTANPDTCDNPSDAVGNQSEATLDVERAGSVAPGASIDLIVSADVNSPDGSLLADGSDIATHYAIDTDPVPARILSISFGVCESETGSADTQSQNQLFEQAAAEGISVFVSSGDSGAAGCEGGGTSSTPSTHQILSINELCAPGYVTCVGGTEFADSTNHSAYWAATDGTNFESALGYIPEGAWNEPLDDNGNPQLAATGGGVSTFIATPSWQTGTGVPGTQGRYTPDVAFPASTVEPFFTCFAAGGGSCVPGSDNQFSFVGAGGTSTSTPSMAGVTALLNQKIGSAQGNLNPRLYALAASPSNGVFHDVTLASSGVSDCVLTTPSLCNNSTPGSTGLSGGLPGYPVGIGYDEATGLGSIDVAKLLAQWTESSTASSVNLDQHGITGSWYNPATGGQGFEIEVYPNLSAGQGLLFAGWFTYDVSAAGGRRWYALSGNVSSASPTATLSIFAVEGGNFNAAPSLGSSGVLGQATITLSDCSTGTLTYNFTDGSGRSGTIPLARLTPNVTCSPSGDNGDTPADYLLSGNWYNPDTGGQGLIFDFSPAINNVFAAWYTFLPDGQQTGGGASQNWFTLQSGEFVNGSTSLTNIAIAETSGGVFNNAAPTTSVQVGTANISFQSCNALTLSYRFTGGANNGLSGTIALTRVGPTPAGCSL